jgi:hypothetical protein
MAAHRRNVGQASCLSSAWNGQEILGQRTRRTGWKPVLHYPAAVHRHPPADARLRVPEAAVAAPTAERNTGILACAGSRRPACCVRACRQDARMPHSQDGCVPPAPPRRPSQQSHPNCVHAENHSRIFAALASGGFFVLAKPELHASASDCPPRKATRIRCASGSRRL